MDGLRKSRATGPGMHVSFCQTSNTKQILWFPSPAEANERSWWRKKEETLSRTQMLGGQQLLKAEKDQRGQREEDEDEDFIHQVLKLLLNTP